MTELDTIVALATPRMTSALAIIRLSGSKTLSILEHIQKKKAENIIPNQSFFANIYEDISTKEKPIDQAVITFIKVQNLIQVKTPLNSLSMVLL